MSSFAANILYSLNTSQPYLQPQLVVMPSLHTTIITLMYKIYTSFIHIITSNILHITYIAIILNVCAL